MRAGAGSGAVSHVPRSCGGCLHFATCLELTPLPRFRRALANWPNLVHLDIPNFYYTPRPNQPHLSPLIVPTLRTLHFQLDHLSALPLFAALVATSAATLTDLELVWESEHVPRAEFVAALMPCLPTLERLLLVNANPRLEDLGYLAVIWWQCTRLTTATVSRGELEGPLMDQAVAATGKVHLRPLW